MVLPMIVVSGDLLNNPRAYPMITHPDISYAVSGEPVYGSTKNGHLNTVHEISKFSKDSPWKGILYTSHGHLKVEAY